MACIVAAACLSHAAAVERDSVPSTSFLIVQTVGAGAVRWLKADGWRNADWGFAAEVRTGVSWRFTEAFAARAAVDYRITTMRTALHCIGFTISSVAYF